MNTISPNTRQRATHGRVSARPFSLAFAAFLAAASLVAPVGSRADTPGAGFAPVADTLPQMTVYKAPMCGCCTKWVDHLEGHGFTVDVVELADGTRSLRSRAGVPEELASCHTAIAGDYWIEGHVPADLVERLLRERPEHIQGIAVPGMPPGSPGMEMPNPVTYQVLSVDEQGQVDVFATRQGRAPD